MSKYRFKTEEEFKRDGLWTKDHPDKWTTSGSMNKYLGQDIPDSYNITCDKQEKLYYETWTFRNCDYVLKEESFVLPSNWCVKVDRNCQPEEVAEYERIGKPYDVTILQNKEEPIYAYVGDPLPTIKTKPLIEDVQSVSVNLRTKKKSIKF